MNMMLFLVYCTIPAPPLQEPTGQKCGQVPKRTVLVAGEGLVPSRKAVARTALVPGARSVAAASPPLRRTGGGETWVCAVGAGALGGPHKQRHNMQVFPTKTYRRSEFAGNMLIFNILPSGRRGVGPYAEHESACRSCSFCCSFKTSAGAPSRVPRCCSGRW